MTKFLLTNEGKHLFGTDDEGMLRNFLRYPGTFQPGLSSEVRDRIIALAQQLPEVLPEHLTIEERTNDFYKRLRLVIKNTSWSD